MRLLMLFLLVVGSSSLWLPFAYSSPPQRDLNYDYTYEYTYDYDYADDYDYDYTYDYEYSAAQFLGWAQQKRIAP